MLSIPTLELFFILSTMVIISCLVKGLRKTDYIFGCFR